MRKHIDGNCEEKIKYWGDSEAVVRSDFIVCSGLAYNKILEQLLEFFRIHEKGYMLFQNIIK